MANLEMQHFVRRLKIEASHPATLTKAVRQEHPPQSEAGEAWQQAQSDCCGALVKCEVCGKEDKMEEDDLIRRISPGRLEGVSRSKAAVAGPAVPERQPTSCETPVPFSADGSDDHGNQPAASSWQHQHQQRETGTAPIHQPQMACSKWRQDSQQT